MQITKDVMKEEQNYLQKCILEIEKNIGILNEELNIDQKSITEFKKFIWNEKHGMDGAELASHMMQSDSEVVMWAKKADYLKKLFRLRKSPYFGRVDFKEDEKEKLEVYIGITNLKDKNENLIYDWRAPISNIFYDSEIGKTSYISPSGEIYGELLNKRQYKIENDKLLHIFDNDVNVTDEYLQEILTNNSTDKMKNIVNSIQKEQNEVIRNTRSKTLIVQGIAGSGKTSVALHRIAFLLYKIKELKSDNILIFSPNNVFSEYISNVLPELGEANAKETTFSDLLSKYLTRYKEIETFPQFVERYYTNKNKDVELTKFKMSDEITNTIDQYIKEITKNARFTKNIEIGINEYKKENLNYLFHDRYSKMTIYERIKLIAEHLCNKENKSFPKYGRTYINMLFDAFNISKDERIIFKEFFKSKIFEDKYGKKLEEENINKMVNGKTINYEDALLLIYFRGVLEGFPYEQSIKQIVIDEAQDYNKLQYKILFKIFPRSSYTILGDVNQNINPYFKYNSLEELREIFTDVIYVELNKTYRSSPEIIEFSNKIMNLSHAVSIRKSNNHSVILKQEKDLEEQLKDDIDAYMMEHNKIAIITKNDEEAEKIYEKIKKHFPKINHVTEFSKEFNRNLVILPAYLAKGLEFDAVIIYTNKNNYYNEKEQNLYYVAVTRAQHQLKIYNQIA